MMIAHLTKMSDQVQTILFRFLNLDRSGAEKMLI